MGMHSLVESHTTAGIMEKKEKEVLFVLSYFFQMSFQTSILASLECNLDSRLKCTVLATSSLAWAPGECQNPNQEQGWLHLLPLGTESEFSN